MAQLLLVPAPSTGDVSEHPMDRTTALFTVSYDHDKWWVDCDVRAFGPFSDREQAECQARCLDDVFGGPSNPRYVDLADANEQLIEQCEIEDSHLSN